MDAEKALTADVTEDVFQGVEAHGEHLWTTGVTVAYWDGGPLTGAGWKAHIEVHDDRFADGQSVRTRLETSYYAGTLTEAIDRVLAVAKRLGVRAVAVLDGFGLYYEDDGESPNAPPPPDWKRALRKEVLRRGPVWRSYRK